MTTIVINVSNPAHPKCDKYIGRARGTNEHFGNPFVVGVHGNREQVIEKFKQWLSGTVCQDVEPERRRWILANMHQLKDRVIGCHCKPKACHGNIYVEKLDGLVIDNFRGDYMCFANFSRHKVHYDGFLYDTSEHAFQAAKAINKEDHDYVAAASGPAEAKTRGREIKYRSDFEEKKVGIMGVIVYLKFDQNEGPRRILVNTNAAELIEGNCWGDYFWGMVKNSEGKWEGKNTLGKILMMVRDMYLVTAKPNRKEDR